MYKLSKRISALLEDYAVAEWGEKVECDWIIGEDDNGRLFGKGFKHPDVDYIFNPENRNKYVKLCTHKEYINGN